MLPNRVFNVCRIRSSATWRRSICSDNFEALLRTRNAPEVRIPPQTPRDSSCDCQGPSQYHHCVGTHNCRLKVDDKKVRIKTFGCQMNKNDTEIVASILKSFGYTIVEDESLANVIFLMTCSIRYSAENKIWGHISQLSKRKYDDQDPLDKIGILGCMAERMKGKFLTESPSVDITVGPDAYRSLPRLLKSCFDDDERDYDCTLSLTETYKDIRPDVASGAATSYLSITRGCDNLCSYCIVPFTRGRERSRPLPSIVDEAQSLLARGVKEITLLGQNVNSYRDVETPPHEIGRPELFDKVQEREVTASGFKTVYKPRIRGLTFDVLLEEVARISPELRIRFLSPHPKDFTDEVIDVIRRYPNIARCIHLPAQSGSNSVLEKMRRGYTKESYLDLVRRMRLSIPDIALTSDFITGFCGETDQDHEETLDLIEKVRYNFIYAFPYSMRNKTHAYHTLKDDVPDDVKKIRCGEVLGRFRQHASEDNCLYVGTKQLVLVERSSKRGSSDYYGKTSTGMGCLLPIQTMVKDREGIERAVKIGDWVDCLIIDANSQTLRAKPLSITTASEFFEEHNLSTDDRMKDRASIKN